MADPTQRFAYPLARGYVDMPGGPGNHFGVNENLQFQDLFTREAYEPRLGNAPESDPDVGVLMREDPVLAQQEYPVLNQMHTFNQPLQVNHPNWYQHISYVHDLLFHHLRDEIAPLEMKAALRIVLYGMDDVVSVHDPFVLRGPRFEADQNALATHVFNQTDTPPVGFNRNMANAFNIGFPALTRHPNNKRFIVAPISYSNDLHHWGMTIFDRLHGHLYIFCPSAQYRAQRVCSIIDVWAQFLANYGWNHDFHYFMPRTSVEPELWASGQMCLAWLILCLRKAYGVRLPGDHLDYQGNTFRINLRDPLPAQLQAPMPIATPQIPLHDWIPGTDTLPKTSGQALDDILLVLREMLRNELGFHRQHPDVNALLSDLENVRGPWTFGAQMVNPQTDAQGAQILDFRGLPQWRQTPYNFGLDITPLHYGTFNIPGVAPGREVVIFGLRSKFSHCDPRSWPHWFVWELPDEYQLIARQGQDGGDWANLAVHFRNITTDLRNRLRDANEQVTNLQGQVQNLQANEQQLQLRINQLELQAQQAVEPAERAQRTITQLRQTVSRMNRASSRANTRRLQQRVRQLERDNSRTRELLNRERADRQLQDQAQMQQAQQQAQAQQALAQMQQMQQGQQQA